MQPANEYLSSTSETMVSGLEVGRRAAFITKTYNHLIGAVLAFTGIEIALFKSGLAEPIAAFMLQGSWMLVLAAFMLVSWMARSVAHGVKARPAQYLALAAYVFAQALMFVPLLYMADAYERSLSGATGGTGVIESAALITILGFGVLTGIVFYTRKDFGFLRAFLGFGGILVLGMILFSAFSGNWSLGPWFSVLMILFAGAAILYDTSKVLHHYPEDAYVAASLELFASIALLFWYVLSLLMSRD